MKTFNNTETNENEFIKLNYSVLNRDWYKNEHTKTLFIHCLLKADCEKGEFITSLQNLANETGLSVQSVRTAIKHLELTGEIESKNIKFGRLITVVNYEMYKGV